MKRVINLVVFFLAALAIFGLYFSTDIIPVYVNGNYVLVNQVIRYALYILLIVVEFCSGVNAFSTPRKSKKRRKKSAKRK